MCVACRYFIVLLESLLKIEMANMCRTSSQASSHERENMAGDTGTVVTVQCLYLNQFCNLYIFHKTT